MSQRDAFLNRLRSRLPQAELPQADPNHPGSFRGYTFAADTPPSDLVDRFTQELNTLSGQVYTVETEQAITEIVQQILQKHGTKQLLSWGSDSLAPSQLVAALTTAGIEFVAHELPMTPADRRAKLAALGKIEVGLTGAHGALADTGAIALISGPGRGRLASLLPPVHIAIVPQQKLYPSLPAFLAAHPKATSDGSNLVFIAGPSRTGDIEMTLTMGVHGPGELHVILSP
ncbi:MAG: lactate utilization protein [Anaerolineae bacterium]|nr:lactate utilization protein [Anaerolineae bacterium]